jgi:ribosomal protein S8
VSRAVAGRSKINLDHFTTAQKNINSAILEYLLKNGYIKSVDTLQDEMASSQSNNIQRNLLLDENTGITHMVNSFD